MNYPIIHKPIAAMMDAQIMSQIADLEGQKPHPVGDTAAWTGPYTGGSLTPASDERRALTERQLTALKGHSAYPVLIAIKNGQTLRERELAKAAANEELIEALRNPEPYQADYGWRLARMETDLAAMIEELRRMDLAGLRQIGTDLSSARRQIDDLIQLNKENAA